MRLDSESTLQPDPKGRRNPKGVLPTLTVIAHPNPGRIGDRALLHGLANGRKTLLSRASPPFSQPGHAIGKPLGDRFISREPLLLEPGRQGGIFLNRAQSPTPGFTRVREQDSGWLFNSEDLDRGAVLVLAERVVLWFHWTCHEVEPMEDNYGLTGFSDAVVRLRKEIRKVADLDTPVLLRGPSGTGKELVSHAIHQLGPPGRPFISVNMGAIPPSLASSELFGAVKGSFTGADRGQRGYFKAAQGGTLFLDEIGEASPEVQITLLRALETGEISPVGAQFPIMVKTRLIAATDADLENKMKGESFKTPLFHRLAGYEIRSPSLCERMEDFGRLFMHFARQELERIGQLERLDPPSPNGLPWLPADLVLRLLDYHWPGNIRQLRNIVCQLIIGCRNEPVLRAVPKIEEMLVSPSPEQPAAHPPDTGKTLRRKPSDISAGELVASLREHRWEIKATAAGFGISRSALYRLIDRTPGLTRTTELDASRISACLRENGEDVEAAAAELEVNPRALRRRMSQLGMS